MDPQELPVLAADPVFDVIALIVREQGPIRGRHAGQILPMDPPEPAVRLADFFGSVAVHPLAIGTDEDRPPFGVGGPNHVGNVG